MELRTKQVKGLVWGEENKGKKLLFIKDISNLGNKSIAKGLFDYTSLYPNILVNIVFTFRCYILKMIYFTP